MRSRNQISLAVMITVTKFHSTPRFKEHHMKSRKFSYTPNRNRTKESEFHESINSMWLNTGPLPLIFYELPQRDNRESKPVPKYLATQNHKMGVDYEENPYFHITSTWSNVESYNEHLFGTLQSFMSIPCPGECG